MDDHPLPERWCRRRSTGTHVGNFYIAQTEGVGTLTDEDEQILFQFAAQAATAIANARAFRKEQRTRADLEALIEISPVGVAVFNAVTGQPESYNREAVRIGEGLRTPGQSIGQLLEVITCRRGDGQEYSLKEFPLARYLSSANRVRAEEIVLSVPGRHVTILVTTPIPSADDTVESLVATMQDLAPIEEIERMRAQFVSTVSHELRAPLMAIQGAAVALLDPSASVPPAEIREYVRLIHEQAVNMRGLISDLLDAGHIEAGTLSVTLNSRIWPNAREAGPYCRTAKNTTRARRPAAGPSARDVGPARRAGAKNFPANAAGTHRRIRPSHRRELTSLRGGFGHRSGPGMPPERLQHVFRKHTPRRHADATRTRPRHGLVLPSGLGKRTAGASGPRAGGLGRGPGYVYASAPANGSGRRGRPNRPG